MNNDLTLALQALERAETAIQTAKAVLLTSIKEKPVMEKTKKETKSKDFYAESLSADQLGPTPDYCSEKWPEAASKYMIVRTDLERQFRATQIAGLIRIPFENMRILDCGCGDGHLAKELTLTAKEVVGYDIQQSSVWSTLTTSPLRCPLTFTADRQGVEAMQAYDAIILYDVFDHLVGQSPLEFLEWTIKLLAPKGRIFIRVHPWTSKHGAELYEQKLNKAYVHLALTLDELSLAGYTIKPNLRVSRPRAAYEYLFKRAGLCIHHRETKDEPADPFFSGALLERIIKINWKGTIDQDTALKIMSTQYIDYYLGVQ